MFLADLAVLRTNHYFSTGGRGGGGGGGGGEEESYFGKPADNFLGTQQLHKFFSLFLFVGTIFLKNYEFLHKKNSFYAFPLVF